MSLPPSAENALSVSQFMAALHGLIKEQVGRVWVVGEVSNFVRAASGHCYFTLKDDGAQVRAVLFRGYAQHLRFELENGMEALVQADAAVYEPRGDLQLIARRVEPRGQGALQLAFEQLRARLAAEGLFAEERKRELPVSPRAIGIVASKHSAALHDVVQVSGRRLPQMPLVVAHSRVQGDGAEREIQDALELLAQREEVDLILLVRGGGSLEDLWCFNTERVARAIAACPVPVVSGVGHEVDVTIADLAADLRAPTPSAAAEMALPDRAELGDRLGREWRRLTSGIRAELERRAQGLDHRSASLRAHSPRTRLGLQRARFDALRRSLAASSAARVQRAGFQLAQVQGALDRRRPSARVLAERAHLEALIRRMQAALRSDAERAHAQLAERVGRLDSLSPLAVLGRGYAIAYREPDGQVLRSAREVAPGDVMRIRLAEGAVRARVECVDSEDSH